MPEPLRKKRRLEFDKCVYCRKDKKKCEPNTRQWPGQKCQRCIEKDLPCSSNQKADGTKAAARTGPQDAIDARMKACSVNVQWLRHLVEYAKHIETVDNGTLYHRRYKRPVPVQELVELVCTVQEQAVRETAELSHELLESGRSLEAQLVSQQLLVTPDRLIPHELVLGSWSYVSAKKEAHSLTTHVDVLYKMGTIGAAEALQHHFVSRMAESGRDAFLMAPQITKLAQLSTEFSTTIQEMQRQRYLHTQTQQGTLPLLHRSDLTRHELYVIQIITERLQSPQTRDCLDRTALHVASEKDNVRIVSRLLKWQVDLHAKDVYGRTALHIACEHGCVNVAFVLVEKGADLNARTLFGTTLLHCSTWSGRDVIMQFLLEHSTVGVDLRNDCNQTPLSYAVEKGHEAVVKILLARDDVNADFTYDDDEHQTLLGRASMHGYTEIVRLLLARDDVYVNSKDPDQQTPLSYAAGKGHEAVVKLLLARDDVEVNSKDKYGNTPLSHAASDGHQAVVKLLLDRDDDDVDVDSKNIYGMTPLSHAAWYGHEAVVRMLLVRDDVDVNSKNNSGITPLSDAAGYGHEAVVKLLLARDDVAVNSKDKHGVTPLSCAARGGSEAVVKLLLARNNIDVNSKSNIDGNAPLSYAALYGHEAVVKLLLARADVDVNPKNRAGFAILACAAWRGQEAVVKLLLTRDDIEVDPEDEHIQKYIVNGAFSAGNG